MLSWMRLTSPTRSNWSRNRFRRSTYLDWSWGSAFASQSSSHSNTPQSLSLAWSRLVAIPESRLAPVRLHTTRMPAASMQSASILVMVVLPFVPTTQTLPQRSLREVFAMIRGSTYRATLPGKFAAGLWNTLRKANVPAALTNLAAPERIPIIFSLCRFSGTSRSNPARRRLRRGALGSLRFRVVR